MKSKKATIKSSEFHRPRIKSGLKPSFAANDSRSKRGVALLVVLFIVMTVTILSLGFLSQSDVELACGENMILRTKMDYLAESGLEHAKGLILNPQEVDTEYWTGDERQQLVAGSYDYYDVNVVKLGWCNYQISCEGYKEKDGEKVGCSRLNAELRLDPCIALWTGLNTTIFDGMTIDGDVYCSGTLTNNSTIDGDVFSNVLNGVGSKTGQEMPVADLALEWPRVTVADFTTQYPTVILGASVSEQTIGPYNPVRVCYHYGDLELAGDAIINGMLVVEGNLKVEGNGNILRAEKNLPALLITSDVIIENDSQLDIEGLAVVNGEMQINAGTADVTILGGLFVEKAIVETTEDSSGNANHAKLYNSPIWRPSGGYVDGALEFDGVDNKVEDTTASTYLNGLSAITVSLWVKSDVIDQDRGIFFTSVPSDSDEELGIRYDKTGAFGGGVNGIKASIRTTSGYTQIESSPNVQTTDWQHLAMVWETGFGLKLYINGQLNELAYDRGPKSGTIEGVEKFMLGRGAKGKYWDGLLDDVRIYNRALDASEIYPIPSEVGLVGHWKLDEEGNSNLSITAAPAKTGIMTWSEEGVSEKWGQAAGAFFRSITRI
ncbi:MAG: hypothetical protein JSV82_03040 [Planctomycetota bacterium]|nr:MAG: hypothetical protein JSV82_03040 [Planctomycetota bacterium]